MCRTETWTTNNNSDPTYIAATPATLITSYNNLEYHMMVD